MGKLYKHCLSPPVNPQHALANRGTRTQEMGDVNSSGSWKHELMLYNNQDNKILQNKHHEKHHHLSKPTAMWVLKYWV